MTLDRVPGSYGLGEIDGAVARPVRDGELVEIDRCSMDRAFVTDRAVKAECRILAAMRAGRGTDKALDDDEAVEEGLRASRLMAGQKELVRTVLLSVDVVVGVQGHAGSGKTTMLRTAKVLLGGTTIHGLARSRTLQYFLTRFVDLLNGAAVEARIGLMYENEEPAALPPDIPGFPKDWHDQIKVDLADELTADGTLYGVRPTRSTPAVMPMLFFVAGPNGCGKSTLTRRSGYGGIDIIDPDAIARGPESGIAEQAEREALRRRRAALNAGQTHLAETTLTGSGVLRHMAAGRREDFRIVLHFVSVGAPEPALDRIRNPVGLGGHDVPEADARRRFERPHATCPRRFRGRTLPCSTMTLAPTSRTGRMRCPGETTYWIGGAKVARAAAALAVTTALRPR